MRAVVIFFFVCEKNVQSLTCVEFETFKIKLWAHKRSSMPIVYKNLLNYNFFSNAGKFES